MKDSTRKGGQIALLLVPALSAAVPSPIFAQTGPVQAQMFCQLSSGQWLPCGTTNPVQIGGSITANAAPANATGAYSAVSIGTTSAQALASSTAKVFLDIVNAGATATIACAFGTTAIINGSGSITIPPNWHRSWEGSFVPSDAVNCIASASSSPATIGAK